MIARAGRGNRAGRWAVLLEGRRLRWGGDVTRHYIFARLAERTRARVVDGWNPAAVREATRLGLIDRLQQGPRIARRRLAVAEMMGDPALDLAMKLADPAVVAVYDDAIGQASALGFPLPPERAEELRRRRGRNLDAFRWHVVPTRSFADLVGLDPARVIVGGNGTDVRRIVPGPWPAERAIGMVSGAAPGRGIENLIEAARLLRPVIPDLALRLCLVATGSASAAYLETLRDDTREGWITMTSVGFDDLGDELARASVLVIPHPRGEYMDVALPVKLFDSLAAGRPLVVTPRTETAAVVRANGVGVVTAGDRPADLASAIGGLLDEPERLRALGARAREVAVERFDWQVVGDAIATEVLAREG